MLSRLSLSLLFMCVEEALSVLTAVAIPYLPTKTAERLLLLGALRQRWVGPKGSGFWSTRTEQTICSSFRLVLFCACVSLHRPTDPPAMMDSNDGGGGGACSRSAAAAGSQAAAEAEAWQVPSSEVGEVKELASPETFGQEFDNANAAPPPPAATEQQNLPAVSNDRDLGVIKGSLKILLN